MAGADEQAVEDGASISGFGAADEEPIFSTNGRGAHVALDPVVVNFNLAVVNVGEDFFPLIEGIGDGLPEPSGGAGGFAISEVEVGAVDQL